MNRYFMSDKGVHDGHRARLRQRYIDNSLDAFADHEVVELLLTYSIPRRDVNALAHKVLDTFGSFSAMADASVDELCKIDGISVNSAVLLSMISQLSKRYVKDQNKGKLFLNNTSAVFAFGQSLYHGEKYERFYILCLDSKCKLIKAVDMGEGTIDGVTVYPRLVVERCLNVGAHSVIIMHNHPSGDPQPSNQDLEMTRDITNALSAIDIRVYDHVIISFDKCFSFNHAGLIKNGVVQQARRAAEIKK